MTIAARNRRIAEALGWWHALDGSFHEENCKVVFGADQKAVCCGNRCNPPDFYRDEAASAMLLEAMPSPRVQKWEHRIYNDRFYWSCSPNRASFGTKHYIEVENDLRLTAIADAFVALVESGWRVKR